MIEAILLLCMLGVVYSYAIYPALLSLIPARRKSAMATGSTELPAMDLIITVHNEQARIREKLENTLAIDYPAAKLNIIIASDASTDQTNAIVGEYADRGVTLVDVQDHKGKEYAQFQGLQNGSSELVVFSDVATQLQPDALQNLAACFVEQEIGAVSSEDRFISEDGSVAGEGLYVKYEMWLRQLESHRAGLVGLSGSFFAARREICKDWDTSSPSDFNTALQCNRQGKSAISSAAVLGYYRDLKDPAKEYQRKVRTVLRGITALMRHRSSLSPSHGLFAFQLWSHKVMRWLVPWFMLGTLLANLALLDKHVIYQLLLLGQCAFYGLGLAAYKIPALRDNGLIKIVFFFLQVNLSIAHASVLYARGTRMTVWSPSQR